MSQNIFVSKGEALKSLSELTNEIDGEYGCIPNYPKELQKHLDNVLQYINQQKTTQDKDINHFFEVFNEIYKIATNGLDDEDVDKVRRLYTKLYTVLGGKQ